MRDGPVADADPPFRSSSSTTSSQPAQGGRVLSARASAGIGAGGGGTFAMERPQDPWGAALSVSLLFINARADSPQGRVDPGFLGVDDGVDPAGADPLELMFPAILERDPGAGDEVADGR